MNVNLNVIGIFYSASTDWNIFPGNTVESLMQYLAKTDENFTYVTATASTSEQEVVIANLSYYHASGFTSPRSGLYYDEGLYSLSGSPPSDLPNPYLVWQYYLFDQDMKSQSTSGTPSFTTAVIQPGWTVTWRLLQIANGPVSTQKRYCKLIPPAARKMQGIS